MWAAQIKLNLIFAILIRDTFICGPESDIGPIFLLLKTNPAVEDVSGGALIIVLNSSNLFKSSLAILQFWRRTVSVKPLTSRSHQFGFDSASTHTSKQKSQPLLLKNTSLSSAPESAGFHCMNWLNKLNRKRWLQRPPRILPSHSMLRLTTLLLMFCPCGAVRSVFSSHWNLIFATN